jgi:hypothetical protein
MWGISQSIFSRRAYQMLYYCIIMVLQFTQRIGCFSALERSGCCLSTTRLATFSTGIQSRCYWRGPFALIMHFPMTHKKNLKTESLPYPFIMPPKSRILNTLTVKFWQTRDNSRGIRARVFELKEAPFSLVLEEQQNGNKKWAPNSNFIVSWKAPDQVAPHPFQRGRQPLFLCQGPRRNPRGPQTWPAGSWWNISCPKRTSAYWACQPVNPPKIPASHALWLMENSTKKFLGPFWHLSGT